MTEKLPDVQQQRISSVKLNRVGVSNIDFPIYIKPKKGEKVYYVIPSDKEE